MYDAQEGTYEKIFLWNLKISWQWVARLNTERKIKDSITISGFECKT